MNATTRPDPLPVSADGVAAGDTAPGAVPSDEAAPSVGAGPSSGSALRLVVVSAGVSDPSSTGMLADRLADAVARLARAQGRELRVTRLELRPLAADVASALVSSVPSERLAAAIRTLAGADGAIVATPVYKAGMSGLLKAFLDVLDNDLLLATPVALAATAGTSRHALVADDQMRPVFAYLRALTAPTSLFAAPEDWGSPALAQRTDRVAGELYTLMASGVRAGILDGAWNAYQHTFGSNAARAARDAQDIDMDTDLMRLAAGGR